MNNNNYIDINNLNLKELEKSNLIELIKISKILGIPTPTKETRIQLYKRIENYIVGKKHYIEKQRIVQFNKFNTNFNDLKIKDTICRGERLFWLIFKNKVLFKYIFSFLKLHTITAFGNYGLGKQYFTFSEIIDVKWMLDNNHLSMLTEKVKNGDSIVCSGNTSNNFTNNQNKKENVVNFFQEIITRVQNINIEFYQNLFYNYSKYIISIDSLIEFIIKHNNLVALKVAMDQFSNCHSSNIQDLLNVSIKHSFYNGFKYIASICSTSFGSMVKINSSQFTNSNITTRNNCKLYKIILYLVDNGHIEDEDKEGYSKLLTELFKYDNQYQHEPYNAQLQMIKIQKHYQQLSNELPKQNEFYWLKLKLKDLINICKLMVHFNNGSDNESNIDFTNYQDKPILKKDIKSILINQKQQPQIDSILKYFLVNTNNLNHYQLFNQFLNNGENEMINLDNFKNNHLLLSLKFANSIYWTRQSLKSTIGYLFSNSSTILKYESLLFKYTKGNFKDGSGQGVRNKKIQFIKEITQFIIFNNQFKTSDNEIEIYTHSYVLLFLVIGLDDLELVKIVHEQLKPIINFKNKSLDNSYIPTDYFYIQKFIKSKPMLEYCYDNFLQLFQLSSSLNHCFYKFKSIELFKRFQELVSPLQTTCQTSTTIEFTKYSRPELLKEISIESLLELLELIKYTIQSNIEYKFNYNIIEYIKVPLKCNEVIFTETVLPLIQFIIKNTPESFTFNPKNMFSRNYQIIKLLNWVIDENDKQLLNRCSFNFNSISPIILIGSRNDIYSLDKYIESYYKQQIKENEFKSNLKLILQGAATYGKLSIFHHLYYNYPNLLIKKTKTIKNNKNNNGLMFLHEDWWFIFYYLVQNDNLDILEFLINVLNYRKPDQFNYYFNEHPLINKLFNKL